MRIATTVVLTIAVFLSYPLSAQEHDPAIGIEVTVISGVMVRTTDKWTYQVAEGTKLLAKFNWRDEGYREEASYATVSKHILGVRLKKIRLADDCELYLELTARDLGDDSLHVTVGGHETSLSFQVR